MTGPSSPGRRGCIHFVYPHGAAISCPDAIGRKVGEHLRLHGHEVRHYDWKDRGAITPAPGDVLLGHAEFSPRTIFRRSLERPGWARTVAMFPFQCGDLWQSAFAARVAPRCDAFLAICGRFWFERIPTSSFAHLAPRARHLDLAVDRADFPALKRSFNPPGRRRLLYIGHTSWYKNPGYLRALAAARPQWDLSWIGTGMPMPGLHALGRRDFRDPAAQRELAAHDFLITVGRADANPTTILEAMAWGLIPVCTPESGYHGQHGIVNLPLDDLPGALAVLDRLQQEPEDALLRLQAENWRALDEHYTWQRFGEQVRSAVEERTPPPPLPACRWRHAVRLRWGEATSPWSPLPPLPQLRWLARLVRNRRIPT